MARTVTATLVAILVLAGALVALGSGPAGASTFGYYDQCAKYAAEGVDPAVCSAQIDAARAASSKYSNYLVALADGFVPTTQCEQTADGAMGMHWARVDRMAVDDLDVRAPEILLYIPSGRGFKLVGLEYEQTARVNGLPWFLPTLPTGATLSPAPRLFGGKVFDGPMAGHVPIQPWHYDLHVYLWPTTNPSGLFEDYNPALSCG